MMARDSARAFYGPGHVQAAHELGAVQTLLITDTLFRVNNVAQVCWGNACVIDADKLLHYACHGASCITM